MKKIHKGEFGYIEYQKKWTLIRTLLYFAICMAVFVIGYMTTGSRKNLLTVVAILGCLPACKSLVNVVMFVRAKGCSQAMYEKISGISTSRKLYGLYDLYMTSYKTNYAISHLAICEKTIVAFIEDSDVDVNSVQNHIQDHLKQDGHKDMTVKAFTDINKYTERLYALSELDAKPLPVQDSILEMLLAISL